MKLTYGREGVAIEVDEGIDLEKKLILSAASKELGTQIWSSSKGIERQLRAALRRARRLQQSMDENATALEGENATLPVQANETQRFAFGGADGQVSNASIDVDLKITMGVQQDLEDYNPTENGYGYGYGDGYGELPRMLFSEASSNDANA